MKKLLIHLLLIFSGSALFAQVYSSDEHYFEIKNKVSVQVHSIDEDWMPSLINLEMPNPIGTSERSKLLQLKEEAAKIRSGKKGSYSKVNLDGQPPIVIRGLTANPFAGIPNDNDMSISNDGMLISVVNSTIFMYDTNKDTLVKYISLGAFADTLGLGGSKYDPKTIYDPVEDKFIIVFLNGYLDSTSHVIVAFSKTNDPTGEWNLYDIPGNPLNNKTWSDYPMIAITKDELFLTVNALYNDSSWQSGFHETLLWQINKGDGYSGNALTTKMYNNIKHNNRAIRNLIPVKGGSEIYGPDIYFLSNRNFEVESDTIFIAHISNTIQQGGALSLKLTHADQAYGVPPQAKQPGNHTFDTNDARILGAFYEDSTIQFVGNTVVPETGWAGIYHGIVTDLEALAPSVTGKILSHDSLEFGYPNISYTGIQKGDIESVITFNHTGTKTFAGFTAIYFGNDSSYSEPVKLKEGLALVNAHGGFYERWGDYSGSQRKYNEPGKVWASGSYGISRMTIPKNVSETWVAALKSPDSVRVPDPPKTFDATAFPNPTRDFVNLNFSLEESGPIQIQIYDISGRLVKVLYNDVAKKGSNLLTFSTQPLQRGMYIIVIRNGDDMIIQEKVIKQ